MGHWVLWDTQHRTEVIAGDVAPTACNLGNQRCATDLTMAAGTFIVPGPGNVDIRAAEDGKLLSSIATTTSIAADGSYLYGLAHDGSIFWTAATSGLSAWSAAGQPLVSRAGD
jgi:hypothetical protein